MGDTPKKDETTTTPADIDPTVSTDLMGEIDAGVEEAMVVVEKDRKDRDAEAGVDDPDKDNLPPEKVGTGEEKPGGKAPGDGKKGDETVVEKSDGDADPAGKDPVTDEVLERAVKAGLSMAEAKQYPNASLLGTVCDRLEKLSKGASGEEGGDADKAGDVDPLAAIPDLDPDEYDEGVVAAVKALKDVVRQQQETISGLKANGKDGEKSAFDAKVEGLGEAFGKALEAAPEKRVALQEQVDVLTAGNKAAGKEVDQGTIFDQAVSITLGDVAAQAATDAKTVALEKRATQHVFRPGGPTATPTTDAFEDVAAEVDRAYFDKK